MALKPWQRRVFYVSFYECFAIAFSSFILAYLAGGKPIESTPVAICISVIATTWNFVYNTAFEYWESRQLIKARSLLRRATQAIGFEVGLICFIIPVYMWWYQIGFYNAIRMEIAILVFFLVYSFSFSWLFDRLFGLPVSARSLTASSTEN
ncbi:PACE efflux transporter [Pseudomonas sp. YQ_13]|uniref:PACE efflux transporter n=1 Tax=Pseudomonas sp. YQ_13 TaxID=3367235 RepID=UPI00370B29A0